MRQGAPVGFMATELEAEALRLKSAALDGLIAEYMRQARVAGPIAWNELLCCERPTLGTKVNLHYLRAVRLLGWRELFGPRLSACLLEQAGRRAAARLGLRTLEDVLALLQAMMVGVPRVVCDTSEFFALEQYECAVCSGLKNLGEAVCSFETGLLAGALEVMRRQPVAVFETKCWGLGDEVCRFEAKIGAEAPPGPDPVEVIAALAARSAQASDLLVRLREREAQLQRLATTDELTGLRNRRAFYQHMAHEIARYMRYGHPVALAVLDVDNFKHVNDTRGHLLGDRTLAAVARLLCSRTRSVDVVARYGGDEFAVLMGDTALENAARAAERLRSCIERMAVAGAGPITVSIGVAAVPPCAPDADALMAAADSALYEAKRAGKNRVAVSR